MKKSIGAKPLAYPTPVFVVGSYDPEGKPNAMTAAWAGICCSSPPSITVSLRKATYSFNNLMERKAFTINIPSEHHMKEADYFGIASGKNEDKFAATGLTPVKSDVVDAPYIEQFPVILECSLRHTLEIGLHTAFVGEVMDIKVDESVLDEKGGPDIKKIAPFIYVPDVRSYYGIGEYLGKAFSVGKKE